MMLTVVCVISFGTLFTFAVGCDVACFLEEFFAAAAVESSVLFVEATPSVSATPNSKADREVDGSSVF